MLAKIKLWGACLLAALTAVLAAFNFGKFKAKAQIETENLTKQNETKSAQLDIAAKPNADPDSIIERMRQNQL